MTKANISELWKKFSEGVSGNILLHQISFAMRLVALEKIYQDEVDKKYQSLHDIYFKNDNDVLKSDITFRADNLNDVMAISRLFRESERRECLSASANTPSSPKRFIIVVAGVDVSQMRMAVSENQSGSRHVLFYKSAEEIIGKINSSEKFATDGRLLAGCLLDLFHGNNSDELSALEEGDKKIVSSLFYKLFGNDVERDPSLLLLNKFMLEQIRAGKFTWMVFLNNDLFRDENLPTVEALSRRYQDYLPNSHNFSQSRFSFTDADLEHVQKLECELIRNWLNFCKERVTSNNDFLQKIEQKEQLEDLSKFCEMLEEDLNLQIDVPSSSLAKRVHVETLKKQAATERL